MNDTTTAFNSGGGGLFGSSRVGGFDQTATLGLFSGARDGAPTGLGMLGGVRGLGFQYGGNTRGLFGPLGGSQAQIKEIK